MESTRDGSRPGLMVRLAFMNQKGGVGKTTTTVNLAAALAATGRPTLLVDLDPQAHASLHVGFDPAADGGPTLYDLFLDPDVDPAPVVRKIDQNLDLLPAHTDMAALETELADASDRHARLERILGRLPGYSFVLIDCPPSLGLLTLNGLSAADRVVIPMQAHYLALQGVGKLLETVSLVVGGLNPRLRVLGAVLCMHETASTHAREVVADMETFFENSRGHAVPWKLAKVLRPAIRRNIKLAECPSFGKTIFSYAPDAPGAADYAALAQSVMAQIGLIEESEVRMPEITVLPTAPAATEA